MVPIPIDILFLRNQYLLYVCTGIVYVALREELLYMKLHTIT